MIDVDLSSDFDTVSRICVFTSVVWSLQSGKIRYIDHAINMSTIKTPAIHSDELSISIDKRAQNRFYCGR